MTEEMIRVDVGRIRSAYKAISTEDIPSVLVRKQKELYDKYNCFDPNYLHDFFEVKRYGKPVKKKDYVYHKADTHNRLHILPVDFTEENKVKKRYIGYLNKLTDKNEASIKNKLQEIITQFKDDDAMTVVLYDIVWDFIKKSHLTIYEDVLRFFRREMTNNYIADYIDKKKWMPSADILDTNLTRTEVPGVYDTYCTYVKWKKEVTNINMSICNLTDSKESLTVLMNDMYALLQAYIGRYATNKHATDFVLEQLFSILKISYSKDIVDRVRADMTGTYESYTKFVILNIVEL